MAEFVMRHDLGHVQHIADVDGTVWQAFGVAAQPAWATIDGDTGATTVEFGALGLAGIEAAFAALR